MAKEGRQRLAKAMQDAERFLTRRELFVHNDSFLHIQESQHNDAHFCRQTDVAAENWVRKGCICNKCVISNYPELGLCEELADFPTTPYLLGAIESHL